MTTDYINYRLTDCWGIDPSTATTFYLQDQVQEKWCSRLLSPLGISQEQLPPIYSSGSVLGSVTEDAAKLTGLPVNTPVALGAFDHPCAARGVGVLESGNMLLSCGTSWVGFCPISNRDKIVPLKMLIDPFMRRRGVWGAMVSIPSIGQAIDELIKIWLSDSYDRYTIFEKLAQKSIHIENGLLINPCTSHDKDFSGYEKQDIARAIMEGTAYLLKTKIDKLVDNGLKIHRITMVGGASGLVPWPQIVSDMLGMRVDVIYGNWAGAVGAAILAGMSINIYMDEHHAMAKLSPERSIYTPNKNLHESYLSQYRVFKSKYSDII